MTEETQQEKTEQPVAKSTETENKPASAKEKAVKASASTGKKIAVVLVRGQVEMSKPLKDTLKMLRLTHKNYCVIVEDNPVMMGMIKKVKDFVTWGEISDETFQQLVEKRGEEFKGRTTDSKKKYEYKTLTVNGKKYKPYFRLNPPRKGFGAKGIKVQFKTKGALGYRSEKMDDLIRRML